MWAYFDRLLLLNAGDYTGAEHHRGGNINNYNAVPLLEGIKLAFPDADVTHVVGATVLGGGHACGGRDGFETIFRHHFKPPAGHLSASAATKGGLTAEYWDNQDLSGPPTLNRTDYAPSFHWYHWGPDPVLLPGSAFSVRWTGTITSDTTVKGAVISIFAANAYGGSAFSGARLAHGADALAAAPSWAINAWSAEQIKKGQFDTTLDLVKGVALPIRMEYRKPDGNGNVELQVNDEKSFNISPIFFNIVFNNDNMFFIIHCSGR